MPQLFDDVLEGRRFAKFIGIDNTNPPAMLGQYKVRDALNVLFGRGVSWRMRPGYEKFNSSPLTAMPKTTYNYTNITPVNELLIFEGGRIQKSTAGTMTQIHDGLARDDVGISTFIDNAGIFDGVTPHKYNGTTVSDLGGSPPAGTMVELSNARWFVAGVSTTPSRVYYCDVGLIETWGVNSYFDVAKNDGTVITGLYAYRNVILIFKGKSIYAINTNGDPLTDWVLVQINASQGCVAGRTITAVLNSIWFLSRDGVFSLDRVPASVTGELEITFRQNDISDTLDTINWSAVNTSCAYNQDGYYMLSVPTGTSSYPDKTLFFDYILAGDRTEVEAWTITDIKANDWCEYENNIYFSCADGVNFYIYKYGNVYSDDTAAINSYVKTGYIYGQRETIRNRFRKIITALEDVGDWNITMEWSIDSGVFSGSELLNCSTGGALYDTAVWDSDSWAIGETNLEKEFISAVGTYMVLKYSHNIIDENWGVVFFETYHIPYSDVGI